MRTKITKLSELTDILVKKSKLDSVVLNFVGSFKVNLPLKSFSELKSQGYLQ